MIKIGDLFVDRVGHRHVVLIVGETRVQFKKDYENYKDIGWPMDQKIRPFWLKINDIKLLEKVTV